LAQSGHTFELFAAWCQLSNPGAVFRVSLL